MTSVNPAGSLQSHSSDSPEYRKVLPEDAINGMAAYFHVLGEPTRLQLLNLLLQDEHNVGGLAEAVGCSAANTSRHLSLMARHGFVRRHTKGNCVYYRIADPGVVDLCCSVCAALFPQHACCPESV